MTSSCRDGSSRECRRQSCGEFVNVVILFRLKCACIRVVGLECNCANLLFWYGNFVPCGSCSSTFSGVWRSVSFRGSDRVVVE